MKGSKKRGDWEKLPDIDEHGGSVTVQAEADQLKVGHSKKARKTSVPAGTARTLSPFRAFIHLYKGNVGPGCFSFAHAASQAGLSTSLILLTLCVAVGLAGWHMIWRCKVHALASGARTFTFGDVGERAFGRVGRDLVEIFVVLTQLAVCSVFFSFFATNLHAALGAAAQAALTPVMLMVVGLPFFLYLGSLRNLRVLVPWSAAANVALAVGFAIATYYCLLYAGNSGTRAPLETTPRGPAIFFGTCVYALEGVALLLPIENAMSDGTRHTFGRVMNWSMVAIVATFLLVLLLPIATLGNVASSSLTAELALHFDGQAVAVCNVLLVVTVVFTYPLQFVPSFQVVSQWLDSNAAARELIATNAGVGDDMGATARSHQPAGSGNGDGDGGDDTDTPSVSAATGFDTHVAAGVGQAESSTLLCPRSDCCPARAVAHADTAALVHEVNSASSNAHTRQPLCLARCPCTMSNTVLTHLRTHPWLRMYLIVLTMVVAAAVPNLGLLIALFGSLTSTTLGLVLPPQMYLRIVPDQSLCSRLGCHFVSTVGILGAIAGSASAMMDIIDAYM